MPEDRDQSQPAGRPTGRERVYVTGLGPVCAFGLGVDAFAGGFWAHVDPVRQLASGGVAPPHPTVRTVPDFDLTDYIEAERTYLDAHSRFALAAGSLAFACASAEPEISDPARSGLATATVFGNMASLEVFHRAVKQKGMRLASPILFPHCYPNTTNSLLCIEFNLRGYNLNFCGDSLCGARTVLAGREAVRCGLADLMLVGGCDALGERLIGLLQQERSGEGPLTLSDGAGFLVLENERSIERRRSTPFSEVVSLASAATGLPGAPQEGGEQERIVQAIRRAITSALDEAGLWEGDIGAVFLATSRDGDDTVSRAGALALSGFSQLPTFSPDAIAGAAFAAAFPLHCIAASLIVNRGVLPAPPKLQNVKKGVELWLEQAPSPMLGDAALVLGWSAHGAMAAILKGC